MGESVRFQHYEVLRRDGGALFELGRGAMGITYKAFDTNLRCDVALKVINATYLNSDVARQRFLREARAAAAIRHPNVAAVYHLGDADDAFFYAMEFINGETVEDFLKREGAVPTLVALEIVEQVARALGAAQKQGLVHRDIKPANLMLVREEGEVLRVKVIDFGLAKAAEKDSAFDAATITMGGFLGTPHFASPEQLEESDLDVRSDIYSLGVTLYYMLAGRTPFSGSLAQVMSQHLHRAPPLEALAGQPPEVVALLERMLEKDPANRPQTPTILRAEIDACVEVVRATGSGTGASAGASVPPPVTPDTDAMETAVDATFVTEEIVEPASGVVLADRFELLESFEPGRFGETYRARNLETNQTVAILILDPKLLPTGDAYTRLEDEVTALQTARHPSIVRVDSLEHVHPISWVAREWVEGPTLRQELRERGPLSTIEIMRILTSIAGGLDVVQKAGVPCPEMSVDWITLATNAETPGQPKFNALNFQNVPPPGFDDGQFSDRENAQFARVGLPGSEFARALAGIAYEVLGGVWTGDAADTFTPVPELSEEGNRVLRRAFDPTKGYRSAVTFIAELAEAIEDSCGVVRAPAAGDVAIPPPNADTPKISRRELDRAPRGRASLAIRSIAAVLVAIGLGMAGWFLVDSRLSPPPVIAKTPTQTPTPAPTPTVVEATPSPTPTATPLVVATPIPTPTPIADDAVRSGVENARALATAGDTLPSLTSLLELRAQHPDESAIVEEIDRLVDDLRPEEVAAQFPEFEDSLQLAANAGAVSAQVLLADTYWQQDPEQFFKYAVMAQDAGSAEGSRWMAKAFETGFGAEADEAKALEYFREAGERGEVRGLYATGLWFREGIGTEPDEAMALHYLKRAADFNHAYALTALGEMYRDGEGVDDPAEALRLIQRAAEYNCPPAQAILGLMYQDGEVLDGEAVTGQPDPENADLATAVAWFRRASENGSGAGARFYAQALENGEGVEPDLAAAKDQYRRAAQLGEPQAQIWCQENGVDWETESSNSAQPLPTPS